MSIRLIGAILLLAVASDVVAATETEEARTAYSISRDLMSPFCPGRTLADCPSPDAAAVRVEILERIREGVPPETVRRDLERRFGDTVKGIPKSFVGWLVPILVLLGGAVGLVFALRRLSSGGSQETGAPGQEEIERQLRDEGL